MSIWRYECTTRTKKKKKLDEKYTRMLHAVLNKFWKQHPTKQQLYNHHPPISQTTQVKQTWHAEHYWRSKEELISDVLFWTPTHGHTRVNWPPKTYQLCVDTVCSLEDLPGTMDDRDRWCERESQWTQCCLHNMVMMTAIFLSNTNNF